MSYTQQQTPETFNWPVHSLRECGDAVKTGLMHYLSLGVPVDYEEAFNCFWNAQYYDAKALYYLAICQITGHGTAQDVVRGFELLKTCEQDAVTHQALSACYQHGWGVTANQQLADMHLQMYSQMASTTAAFPPAVHQAVQQPAVGVQRQVQAYSSYQQSQQQLPPGYQQSTTQPPPGYQQSITQQQQQAIYQQYTAQPQQNFQQYTAQNQLNYQQYNAQPQPQDTIDYKAKTTEEQKCKFREFLKQAEQGNAEMQLKVGHCYRQGNFVSKNQELAIKWYQLAAAQGNATASEALAKIQQKSQSVPQQQAQPVQTAPNVNTRNNYGPRNQASNNHQQNLWAADVIRYKKTEQYNSVFQWLLGAAEQGDCKAQHLLGQCYSKGIGVERNSHQALDWYQRAAQVDYAPAIDDIGYLYERGFGVAKDVEIAIQYYTRAAQKGNKGAIKNLQRLGAVWNDSVEAAAPQHPFAQRPDQRAFAQYQPGNAPRVPPAPAAPVQWAQGVPANKQPATVTAATAAQMVNYSQPGGAPRAPAAPVVPKQQTQGAPINQQTVAAGAVKTANCIQSCKNAVPGAPAPPPPQSKPVIGQVFNNASASNTGYTAAMKNMPQMHKNGNGTAQNAAKAAMQRQVTADTNMFQ